MLVFLLSLMIGASNEAASAKLTPVRLLLNWVPEPEFGGYYAAAEQKIFEKHGLQVEIISGGAGAPTVQLLAANKVEFAITSGGEIVTARSRGAQVKALQAVYQTSPLIIMSHRSKGYKRIEDVFKSGTLAVEQGHAFVEYLKQKYPFTGVKLVPYTGGIGNFLNDKNFSQQGFLFSEPILARRQGAEPQVFLVADTGFNPYIEVLATNDKYLASHPQIVESMVKASREGWESYIKNPKPVNEAMAKLNKAMDLQTFHEAARDQEPLLKSSETRKNGFGWMSIERWKTMIEQLSALKITIQSPKAEDCFKNHGGNH